MFDEGGGIGLKKGRGRNFNDTLKLHYPTCWQYRTGTGDAGQSKNTGEAIQAACKVAPRDGHYGG